MRHSKFQKNLLELIVINNLSSALKILFLQQQWKIAVSEQVLLMTKFLVTFLKKGRERVTAI
ncbi:hypothetical protein MF4642_05715 [Acinetobacter sp. MF4642]|nr:hypothetical protein MF4642_05715 [Acinetobacter sp. MF4642]